MSDNFEDTTNSEIDVERLLAEIRGKLALREQLSESKSPGGPDGAEIKIPERPVLDTSVTRSAISSAEAQADVGSQVTPMFEFHGLIRKLALIVGKIVVYFSSFITAKQRSFNRATITAFTSLTQALEKFNHDIGVWVRNEINQTTVVLKSQVESHTSELNEILKILRNEQAEAKGVLDGVIGQMASLRNEQAETKSSLEKTIKNILEDFSHAKTDLTATDSLIRDIEKTVKYLKSSYALQDRRLVTVLESAMKHFTGPLSSKQMEQTLSVELKHSFDALYVLFEDQFRGSRQEIQKRQEVYLPVLKGSNIGTEEMPVLDLGCGRGEWLELLKEAGFHAGGVDINHILVAQCGERGLAVEEEDMIAHLRSLPDASLGAVTGFHIVEHLPFEVMLGLLDETIRVLKPGGLAIFETPNPQNVLVGSCNFYLDPTHRSPLPSPMMKFMAEARGFSKVEILNLHPYPASFLLSGSELADRFNEYFYGPQDYAVIGWKE